MHGFFSFYIFHRIKTMCKTKEEIEFEAQEAWDRDHPDQYDYDDEEYDPICDELDD